MGRLDTLSGRDATYMLVLAFYIGSNFVQGGILFQIPNLAKSAGFVKLENHWLYIPYGLIQYFIGDKFDLYSSNGFKLAGLL